MATDYQRFAILYVDDEAKSLKNFARAFGGTFRILTAQNALDGLRVLGEHPDEIGVLMTDERMPGEHGVWLLEKTRRLHPGIVRILVTAYADMEAAICAVNSGAIYKYITKPWDPPELETLLKRALDLFTIQRERDQLLSEKVSILHNMTVADRIVSLGLLAAGMSHHIRNALVAVKTFLELTPAKLQAEGLQPGHLRDPDFWGRYWQDALGQLDRINGMLRDLWVAAERPPTGFNDQVQLREVVAQVVAKLQPKLAQAGVAIDTSFPDTLPVLSVDGSKFHRLFELLFEDEIAYLPRGARISIAASMVDVRNPAPEIRIEVKDNGPGLPSETLRTIFDPFNMRTESPSDYGIRLMACFFIVHYHRGSIVAQSAEGKGTSFVLKLPVNPGGVPAERETELFLQKVKLNDEVWAKLLSTS